MTAFLLIPYMAFSVQLVFIIYSSENNKLISTDLAKAIFFAQFSVSKVIDMCCS